MIAVSVERAFDAGDELGEGATWDAIAQQLVSVDIMRGRVHRFDPLTGQVETVALGQPVGAAVPCRTGGLLVAVRDGFATVDSSTGSLTFIAHVASAHP